MTVRRAALDRLGETAIRRDQPMALVEEVLVPVFLHHRYQVDAAASALGGQSYVYALRGDGETPRQAVPAAEQRAALDALLETLAPAELLVPKRVLDALPPRPSGFDLHRELFPRDTGLPFDPITPGLTAADITLTRLLDPARAARLVSQAAYDATLPSFGLVVNRLVATIVGATPAGAYAAEVNRAVQRALVDRLMTLAAGAPMSQVRAVAASRLRRLAAHLRAVPATNDAAAAHAHLLAADIDRFLTRPYAEAKRIAAPPPPGAPIGSVGPAMLSADDAGCGVRPAGSSSFFPPLFAPR